MDDQKIKEFRDNKISEIHAMMAIITTTHKQSVSYIKQVTKPGSAVRYLTLKQVRQTYKNTIDKNIRQIEFWLSDESLPWYKEMGLA